MRPAAKAIALAGAVLTVACGGATPDARYPAREAGCPVRKFPGEATIPVDDLGVVTVSCDPSSHCERRLLDAVCARGGDVAWGVGDNALTSANPTAHAAHSKRVTGGPRERGCGVQVFNDAAPGHVENIGPVTAICAQDDSREICLRELEDQVCLVGGDVLWQIDGPTPEGNKQRMHGRAAHVK